LSLKIFLDSVASFTKLANLEKGNNKQNKAVTKITIYKCHETIEAIIIMTSTCR
jgi:hypothetical protein